MTPSDKNKIIGGVVGGVCGLLALGAVLLVVLRRRSRPRTKERGLEGNETPKRKRLAKFTIGEDKVTPYPLTPTLSAPPVLPPIPPSPQISLDDRGTSFDVSKSSLDERNLSLDDRRHSYGEGYGRASLAEPRPAFTDRPLSYQTSPHSATGTFGPLTPITSRGAFTNRSDTPGSYNNPPGTPGTFGPSLLGHSTIGPSSEGGDGADASAGPGHRTDSAETVSTLGALKEALYPASSRVREGSDQSAFSVRVQPP